jgi:antitoxin component YwqK of YwqJK toxin-antitoxin module
MKYSSLFLLGALALLAACGPKNKSEDPVVSQKYIHKYGYAVSKEEWEERHFPGQVVTTLRNGVTITATYEGGMLHGPTTHTYPNSQTVEAFYLYNQGDLVKQINYDVRGMPVREQVQLSPSRLSITLWYHDGTPMSIEEYAHEELLEGQYFSVNNEVEARVEKGNGLRLRRDHQGTLLSRDEFDSGYMVKRESFYASGSPECVTHYSKNKLNGEKRTFSPSGEPIAIEEWVDGQLHGKATYFRNGSKYLEVSYLYGSRNGLEVHYIDGGDILQEISWENDKKHGPSIFYVDGQPNTQWYYDGKEVSERTFQEQLRLDEMVSHISPTVQIEGGLR